MTKVHNFNYDEISRVRTTEGFYRKAVGVRRKYRATRFRANPKTKQLVREVMYKYTKNAFDRMAVDLDLELNFPLESERVPMWEVHELD